MIIDFKEMDYKQLPNFKGGEKAYDVKMVDAADSNRFMKGLLKPGATIGMHTHQGNCEVIYVLEGEGTLVEGESETKVFPGMCLYCADGETHSLQNRSDKDLHFFATVVKQ